jgi:hypothetical protein
VGIIGKEAELVEDSDQKAENEKTISKAIYIQNENGDTQREQFRHRI